MKSEIVKGEGFQVGEVWQSPRGFLYKVVEVVGSQATLRMGTGGSGRKARRWVYSINDGLFTRGMSDGLQQAKRPRNK